MAEGPSDASGAGASGATGASGAKAEREATEYGVFERDQDGAGRERLTLITTEKAFSSDDADRQYRQKLEKDFEDGERSGEVEYRCIAIRYADPIYFAAAETKTVVSGGKR